MVNRSMFVALVLVTSMGPMTPSVLVAADEAGSEDRTPVAETEFFTFYSALDFNLYDALLAAAADRASQRVEAMQGEHGSCFDELRREERSAWNAAVDYYAINVASTSDFSRERTVLRTTLIGRPLEDGEGDATRRQLGLLFLEAAKPAYRSCMWPQQDAANREWISALLPLLERHGTTIAERLQRAYGISWRALPIPVDLVAIAGWAGADTMGWPYTHIQIGSASAGNRGLAALEVVFHEASHELIGPRFGPVADALAQAADKLDVAVPDGLWHVLLFVTLGEVTRDAYEKSGVDDYVPYGEANGVYRGSWKTYLEPARRGWLPFVRGTGELDAAIEDVLEEVVEGY